MIQHTHLTAWQTHAPWPKRSQIEQDLRLSRGVSAIFADHVLSDHLAMRDGTVLRWRFVRYCGHPGFCAPLYPLVEVELDTLDDDGERIRAVVRSYGWNCLGSM